MHGMNFVILVIRTKAREPQSHDGIETMHRLIRACSVALARIVHETGAALAICGLAAFLPLVLWSAPGVAMTAQEKGLFIAQEMHRRDQGWGDQRVSMEMILRNRQGQSSTRQIRVHTLEVDGDGDKSLTVFDEPRDLKGTAFLSFTHALEPDDQWLYLPALKRVKRISSANKSGPFMGSEFAYEDLTSQEVAKYTYRWLQDEILDGRESMVVERVPAYENSGYTRQVVWVDKIIWQPLKVDYYDRKHSLLKTLTVSGYQSYHGRFWRASSMDMDNHQSGKSTMLKWTGYEFMTGLSEADFDRNSLQRAR